MAFRFLSNPAPGAQTNKPTTDPSWAWYSHIGQSGAEVLVNVGLENRVEMLELDVSYQWNNKHLPKVKNINSSTAQTLAFSQQAGSQCMGSSFPSGLFWQCPQHYYSRAEEKSQVSFYLTSTERPWSVRHCGKCWEEDNTIQHPWPQRADSHRERAGTGKHVREENGIGGGRVWGGVSWRIIDTIARIQLMLSSAQCGCP